MEFQQNRSRPIVLSRDVVITEGTSIPSKLLLGKLVSDAARDMDSLRAKLMQNWAPSGLVNFWPVTDGAFLIQFHEAGVLTRVLDGAPWSCDRGDLFLVQHVKPDMNILDQIAGFTKAEVWVQFLFHQVPEDDRYSTSVYALAERIGEPLPVNCEPSVNSGNSLRARIRVDITRPLQCTLDVELENGKQAWVSVVYEGFPTLCGSCRILGHPADRCGRAKQPAAAAGSRREKTVSYAPSPLGSRRSTSGASLSSLAEKSPHRDDLRVLETAPPSPTSVMETAPAPPTPRSEQGRHFSVKGGFSNILKPIRLKKSTKEVGEKKPCSTGDNSEDENQAPQTDSVHVGVQEPSIIDLITRSHCIMKPEISRSGKHTRIDVVLETQCSSQLIMGAMQWLSKKAEDFLSAEYDGNKGIVSIYGMQIDQDTDPVDLITHLRPKKGPKIGRAETSKKPDSPARFTNIVRRLHDVRCLWTRRDDAP